MPHAPPPLRKILVAIDGSESSEYALNLAIKLGTHYQSTAVDLIHVSRPQAPVSSSSQAALTTSDRQQPKKDNKKGGVDEESGFPHLLADRRKLLINHGLQCNGISLESSDVAGEILSTTAKGGYDLTMLGSRGVGVGGLRRFLMGSVSTKVARESKHSVLIAKAKIGNVPKILLGYDGSGESNVALAFAIDLGKRFHAPVTVASVVVAIATEGYVGSSVEKWEKEMRGMVDSALTKIKAEGVDGDGRVIDSPDIARALSDTAEKGKYDLIIVGSRGRGRLQSLFLGSVASGIANSSRTNVLITR